MNTNRYIIIAVLVMSQAITKTDADRLTGALEGASIPDGWRDVVKQVEEIIGHKIATR